MFEIFKSSNGSLVDLKAPVKNSWINLESPTEKDLVALRKVLDVPDEIFSSLKDGDELPRTEKYDDFLFIVFRIPSIFADTAGASYGTVPLGILIHENYLITICFFQNEVISSIKSSISSIAGFSTAKKIRATLTILLFSARLFLKYLKDINRKSIVIQKDLEKSMKNEELILLLTLEKSLVYFSTSLRSNNIMVEKLTNNKVFTLYEDDRELLDDVLIENRQALELTNIYSNILSGTMDAFASIINNNLNIVMKFLTTVTIILMIPTLVASIYGMNIELPLQHSEYAFPFILLVSISLALMSLLIFWKKNFL